MCGTMPSGHWCANSVSISVQARSSSKWRWPSAVRQESQFHWNGIEPLGRHRVGAAVVLAQDGDGAVGQVAVGGHRTAPPSVSGSNQRMRSGCGTRLRRSPGATLRSESSTRAEQRAVDVGGDQRVRPERLDHPDRRRDAAGAEAHVLGADGELDPLAGRVRAGIVEPATRPATCRRRGARRQEVHRRVADEGADEAGGRVAVDLDRRSAGLDDAAAVHHRDPVGELHRLDLVVGDVDRGGPGCRPARP